MEVIEVLGMYISNYMYRFSKNELGRCCGVTMYIYDIYIYIYIYDIYIYNSLYVLIFKVDNVHSTNSTSTQLDLPFPHHGPLHLVEHLLSLLTRTPEGRFPPSNPGKSERTSAAQKKKDALRNLKK